MHYYLSRRHWCTTFMTWSTYPDNKEEIELVELKNMASLKKCKGQRIGTRNVLRKTIFQKVDNILQTTPE